jgi:hypothetical protein
MANNNNTFTPVILHVAPVLLGLHCLTLSLSNYSVFRGYEENEPGTWISLIQMFIVLLLLIPALRQKDIKPGKRKMAFILTPVISLSILDELYGWHEAIGRYAMKHLHILPEKIVHYTDDILIIIGALIGGALLYYCIKQLQEEASYQPYFLAILFVAIGHGELDLLAHRQYVWQLIWPDLTYKQAYSMLEVLGFFEESFKLWCEWFVIIFLLRVYYNQKGFLLWSMLIFAATLIAPTGLWGVTDVSEGIPYIIMGKDLKFIRNYHLLIKLAPIWLLWTAASWYYFKNDDLKRALSGLFFFSPFYLLLPQLTLWPLFERPDISLQQLTANAVMILKTGGLLFPVIIFLLIKEHTRKKIMAAAAAAMVLGFSDNPLWLLVIFGIAFIYWIKYQKEQTGVRFWKPLVALHILTVLIVSYFFLPSSFLPNRKFKPAEKVMFQVGHQLLTVQPQKRQGKK